MVHEQHSGATIANGVDCGGEARYLRLGKARRGLVHEHEARLRREGPSHSQPALVAVRQRRGGLVRIRGEPEQAHELVRPPRRFPPGGADPERRDLDVLPHREAAEGVRVLEGTGEPMPPAPVRRPAGDVALLESDLATRRPVEAAEDVDERRLAGPVRADQADDLARLELERDVTQRLHARERTRHGGGPERSSGPPLRLRVRGRRPSPTADPGCAGPSSRRWCPSRSGCCC